MKLGWRSQYGLDSEGLIPSRDKTSLLSIVRLALGPGRLLPCRYTHLSPFVAILILLYKQPFQEPC
jgi:hypothetical protein